eukprot:c10028_g1_i2 orf=3-290(+)
MCFGDASRSLNQVQVEVMEVQEGVHVHVECEKREGLAAMLLDAIENSGLILSNANLSLEHSIIIDVIGQQREDMLPIETESLMDFLLDIIHCNSS